MSSVRSTRQFSLAMVCILATLFAALPIVNWLALGPHIPEGTFFLISQLGQISATTDPSNVIYSFARPPIYHLLGWLFAHPGSFMVAGFLAHAAFNTAVFTLAYSGAASAPGFQPSRFSVVVTVAAILTALVYPIALIIGVAGSGTTLIPHDAYHQFSFRTIFSCVAAVSYWCLLTRRTSAALLFASLCCYIHPTAGLLLLGLLSIVVVIELRSGPWHRLLMVWLIAVLAGTAPTLARMIVTDLPQALTGSMDLGAWYSQLIKDEADDFSFLYQIFVYPKHTLRLLLVIIVPLALYASIFPDFARHRDFWFAAAVPVLFLAGAAAEMLFAAYVPTPLVYLLSALTPGYRLLSFAFFPLIPLLARVIVRLLAGSLGSAALGRLAIADRMPVPALGAAVVLVSCLALLAAGVRSGNFQLSIGYARWAAGAGAVAGIDAYLSAMSNNGADWYVRPRLAKWNGSVRTYPGERNILRILQADKLQPESEPDVAAMQRLDVGPFLEVIAAIRAVIPEGNGLIIPPYLRFVRDALPRHPVFFQEHHDGNLMMGSPAFMAFWRRRMIDLLGFDYEGMPSKYSGLSFSYMRNAYLALDDPAASRLHSAYPAYPYFVTEVEHILRFERVLTTRAFVVYDLGRPK